ncbi:MAG: PrsW family intramembrane metalloprotease [Phycisphaerales bacterium]
MDPLMLAAVIAGTLVVFGYLVVIWWLDRYEREPFWLALVVFAWGGFGGTSLGCLCSLPFVLGATAVGGEAAGTVVGAVVVAPLIEEVTKGLAFLLLLLTRHLDNETDGLIYGAAAGLGFAAVENIMYAMAASSEGATAVVVTMFVRTFLTALVHCISSGILGMSIGYARHRSGAARWIVWPAVGFFLAVLNHAVWNGLATAVDFEVLGESSVLLAPLGILIVLAAAAGMFGLTQWSLAREHRTMRRHLLDESVRGTLPTEHARIIPYWSRRKRRGWLPAHVPHEAYVRAATLLAFRLNQLEVARGERREQYLADIAGLRAEVRGMLDGSVAV